jgi:hypothetical protein
MAAEHAAVGTEQVDERLNPRPRTVDRPVHAKQALDRGDRRADVLASAQLHDASPPTLATVGGHVERPPHDREGEADVGLEADDVEHVRELVCEDLEPAGDIPKA